MKKGKYDRPKPVWFNEGFVLPHPIKIMYWSVILVVILLIINYIITKV